MSEAMRSALDDYDARALEEKRIRTMRLLNLAHKVGVAVFLALMLMVVITLFSPTS